VTLALASTLLGVGFLSAFFAGLLGIGGALVMIPLLLYVPPLVGVGQLDIKAVAASRWPSVRGGALRLPGAPAAPHGQLADRHRRRRGQHRRIVRGRAVVEDGRRHVALAGVRGIATVGAALILLPGRLEEASPGEAPHYSSLRIAAVAGGVGLAAGFVGAGGAFLLVPLLVVVVGVPIRTTIGSSLGITALSATAGFVGKLVSHQILFGPALAVAVGAIPGPSSARW